MSGRGTGARRIVARAFEPSLACKVCSARHGPRRTRKQAHRMYTAAEVQDAHDPTPDAATLVRDHGLSAESAVYTTRA